MDQVASHRRFGTFTGVFTPTLLTILGVIMYVRLGWVVGNAGLLGALLILFVALGITVCTGLSLSSIATNTQIGDGGPYAVIARSLGLEVGGSVGIPLYLSRPLGVAMYIIGFREGWQWIFPDHHPLAIDLVVFGSLFVISWMSAELAFKVQYVIMAIIVASLASIFLSEETFQARVPITWWGEFPGFPENDFGGIGFWGVFAVFFPASTGILAGANMSGDLKDPRRAIPGGALWAIGVSSVIYVALAVWAAMVAPMEELASDYNLFIDYARWPSVVVAGLLGATFSSALAGIVGGPRILMAMGQNRLLPYSGWLASTRSGAGARGQPHTWKRIRTHFPPGGNADFGDPELIIFLAGPAGAMPGIFPRFTFPPNLFSPGKTRSYMIHMPQRPVARCRPYCASADRYSCAMATTHQ